MNFDGLSSQSNHFDTHEFAPPPPKRRKKWKWLFLFLILLGIGAAIGYKYLSQTNQIFTNDQNIFQRIGNLLLSPDKELIGEENGQINVLLLGIGGEGHDGPLLTDTMIVAQINVQTKEVILTSIPRDFLVTIPSRGYQKINAVYTYSELDDGTGGKALISEVEELTGLKIPYFALIDFKGFIKAVDHVGGLDISIDRTFTDSTYPDFRNGYLPPVTFTKGTEHMDGQRALVFARSRHGNNGEGSDFARSERQKKIILALKEKALKLNLSDVKTLNNLLNDFTENFRTNFEPYELKRLANIVTDISENNVYSFSLDPDNELICAGLIDLKTGKPPIPIEPEPTPTPTPAPSPTPPATSPKTSTPSPTPSPTPPPAEATQPKYPSSTAYVVLPCAGKTIADIHTFLQSSAELAKLKKEGAVVEVQNSTGKSGLAASLFSNLDTKGLDIRLSAYTGKVSYDQSIIYDNSHGSKPNTLEFLKSHYHLIISDVNYTSSTADFVIILGKDAL